MASNSPPPSSDPSPNTDDRYFCHRCVREVDNINREAFTCPFCNQGFLEQLPNRSTQEHADRSVSVSEEEEEQGPPHVAAADFQEFFRNFAMPLLFPGANNRQDQPGGNVPQQPANAQPTGGGNAGQRQQVPPMFQFFQNLMEGLAGAQGGFQVEVQFGDDGGPPQVFGFPFQLHGNPGDYAWGPGGLDEIVTRLLNQFEGGPPPLTEEQIRAIPQVLISQEQVDKRLQCTVCMDDFKLDENVRRLSCGHHFHDDCIVPWLNRHNTCPVCRKVAVEIQNTTDNNQGNTGGGPSGSNNSYGNRSTQGNRGQPAWDVIEELD